MVHYSVLYHKISSYTLKNNYAFIIYIGKTTKHIQSITSLRYLGRINFSILWISLFN